MAAVGLRGSNGGPVAKQWGLVYCAEPSRNVLMLLAYDEGSIHTRYHHLYFVG